MTDVRIVKDSADGLTEQICSRMALNTGVFNGRDVIADMPKCECGDVSWFSLLRLNILNWKSVM